MRRPLLLQRAATAVVHHGKVASRIDVTSRLSSGRQLLHSVDSNFDNNQTYDNMNPEARAAVSAQLKMIRENSSAFPIGYMPDRELADLLDLERDDVKLSLENLERTTGLNGRHVLELLQYAPQGEYQMHCINRLMTWKDIHRGSDLFLPGLGKFDVRRVVEAHILQSWIDFVRDFFKVVPSTKLYQYCEEDISPNTLLEILAANRQRRFKYDTINSDDSNRPLFVRENETVNEKLLWQCLYSGSLRLRSAPESYQSTGFWLPSVMDLRSRGYFAAALSRDGEDRTVALFLQDILCRPETSLLLNYLLRHKNYWDDPDRILTLIDAVETFDAATWEKAVSNHVMPPPERLLETLSEVNPGFEHLATLPDFGNFRVLRNKYQLLKTGKRFHNCLSQGAYIDSVGEKEMLFVCLDSPSGKPIAVGRYSLVVRQWKEIGISQNRDASVRYQETFEAYSKEIIEPWLNKQNLPLPSSSVVVQDEYFERNLGLVNFGGTAMLPFMGLGIMLGGVLVGSS